MQKEKEIVKKKDGKWRRRKNMKVIQHSCNFLYLEKRTLFIKKLKRERAFQIFLTINFPSSSLNMVRSMTIQDKKKRKIETEKLFSINTMLFKEKGKC